MAYSYNAYNALNSAPTNVSASNYAVPTTNPSIASIAANNGYSSPTTSSGFSLPSAAQIGVLGKGINQLMQPGATSQAWGNVANGIGKGIGAIQTANTNAQSQLAPFTNVSGAVAPTIVGNATNGAYGIQQGQAGLAQSANTPLNVSAYYNPGMNFAMQQGQYAIERSAAARGGVINGAALKDISSYITGVASQNYNNAANLALGAKNSNITANTALANTGLQSNAQLGSLYNTGASAAGTGAQLNVTSGANAASGYAAQGNARGQQSAASGSNIGSYIQGIATIASLFSDSRVKIDIRNGANYVKAILDALEEKTFEYDDYAIKHGAPEGVQVGILADDFKGKVVENEDGIKVLPFDSTMNFLLASVANLNARINELEAV